MKRFLTLLLPLLLVAALPACESSAKKKKPKPVPPSADVSGLPWNRPQSWEGGAGFGGMLPQSR
jgi:hypothetical protein